MHVPCGSCPTLGAGWQIRPPAPSGWARWQIRPLAWDDAERAGEFPRSVLCEWFGVQWVAWCWEQAGELGYRPPAPEAIVQMDQRPIMH